jgi:site-specific recombinase XerD
MPEGPVSDAGAGLSRFPGENTTMRIDQALDLYVQQLRADGRSQHTVRQYQRHIRLLDAWFGGHKHVEDVTHEDLARFLNSDQARQRLDARPKRPTSTNALRSSIRTFFSYAHAAGLAPTNAGRLIRRARCAPPPPRGLSLDEQRRLLETLAKATGEAAERDRVLFELMLASGIRVGSALALNVGDVHLERGELLLRTTKGDRPMTVYFNARVGALLAGLIGDRLAGPLFESRHRRRISARQVAARLAHWCREAKIKGPTCPHGLRHAFATDLYRRTGDVLLVKEALGHRSVASTVVYVQVDQGRLRAALA